MDLRKHNPFLHNTLKQAMLDRTFAHMNELDLDILIAASTDSIQNRGNVRFLTNYATASGSGLVVVPKGDEPALLVPAGSFQSGWAQETAWVTDIRPVQDFAAATVDTLAEIGEGRATVGLVGSESLPGFIESQIVASMPTTDSVGSTDSFRLMRSVKTAIEIDMARRSVMLADSVFENLSSVMGVGVSERKVFASVSYRLATDGAEDYFLLGSSGAGNVVMPTPADRALGDHGIFRLSVEPASSGGFWTQTIRVFLLADPAPQVRAVFDLCHEALEWAGETLEPGVTGGELATGIMTILERAEDGAVGPCGHGMGLDLTEPPYVLPQDETAVEPGMAIAIHPHLTCGEASIWLGDTFLITEHGSEKLSKTSHDLHVL
jgi:Xaa-Pro dipeptidase